MGRSFFITMLLLLPLGLHAAESIPKEFEGIGIIPQLGTELPKDLHFRDEEGRDILFSKFFNGQKPVVLALAYYECPNLCTFLLNGATESFKKLNWSVGKEFEFVAVSIDPKDDAVLAKEKKEAYLDLYKRPETKNGWHFLTGDEKQIRALADTVGFGYRYDSETKEYLHAAGLFILTPQGKLARVLSGIQFPERDMKLALLESASGKIGNMVDRLLLFCYRYDPKENKYALFATRLMKVGGAGILIFLGGLVSRLKKKESNV